MNRLVASLGERAALLEWETRVRRQTQSDLMVKLTFAEGIVVALRAVKGPIDPRWMLRERSALKPIGRGRFPDRSTDELRPPGADKRARHLAPRPVDLPLCHSVLFIVESTVTLAIDKVLFFFSALKSSNQSPTWERHRSAQLRVSLYTKLRQHERYGAPCFAGHINRELRNNLAHAQFPSRHQAI